MSDTSTYMLEGKLKPSVPACGLPRDGEGNEGATPTVTVETVLDVRDNDSTSRREPAIDDTMGGASKPYMYPRLEIATETVERNGLKRLGKVVAKRVG